MANINAKGLRLAIKQQFLASRRRWLSAMDAAWFDIAKGIIKYMTAVGDPGLFLASDGTWAAPTGGNSVSGILFVTGTTDPSIAPGVPAERPALYVRTGVDQLWLKTGPADIDWALIS